MSVAVPSLDGQRGDALTHFRRMLTIRLFEGQVAVSHGAGEIVGSTHLLESVAKTSRLVISQEANTAFGAGVEVVARVADQGIGLLDAPIPRIGLPDSRIPSAPALRRAVVPGPDHVVDTVLDLLDADL